MVISNIYGLKNSPWILLCVLIAGLILAFFTEGENTNVLTYYVCDTVKLSKQISRLQQFGIVELVKSFEKLKLNVWFTILNFKMENLKKKFYLYKTLYNLKSIASSKRHIFYLLQKKTLQLEIKKNETEVESYLDCKKSMGEKWPFMWEVSNVRAEKIICKGSECHPMSSYSYLNLMRDERVQQAAINCAKLWSSGNHGPRMLGGNMSILIELEKCIAKFLSRDSTLLCASGYLACMSAAAAIATECTVVFADTRLHASLRSGLTIGQAKICWFKHNDFKDCEQLVRSYRHKYKEAWIIIESVYSMDGDIGDLRSANALCKKYNIKLLIDEAHGLGVLGKTGRGLEEHYNMPNCATVIVGTFSKSIASIGGFIAGNRDFISYLDFHATGNVFSAPLPAYCAGAAMKSFEIISTEPEIVTKTQEIAKTFRKYLSTGLNLWPKNYPEVYKYKLEGDPATTVFPIIFENDIDRIMRIASELRRRGYMVSAVAYPACPLKSPRFRITATLALTDQIMRSFVSTLVSICLIEAPSSNALNAVF